MAEKEVEQYVQRSCCLSCSYHFTPHYLSLEYESRGEGLGMRYIVECSVVQTDVMLCIVLELADACSNRECVSVTNMMKNFAV